MWVVKNLGAINVRKTEFIKSVNLRRKLLISARNDGYEIKKLQLMKLTEMRKYYD
jgi:hypothetical protein